MNIFESISSWVPHIIISFSVLGLIVTELLKIIPSFVNILLLRILFICTLCYGIWLEGVNHEKEYFDKKVQELTIKIKEAEINSANVNSRIVEKIVYMDKIIEVKSDGIKEIIEKERIIINSECNISDNVWMLYNSTTQNEVPGSSKLPNGTTTGKIETSTTR